MDKKTTDCGQATFYSGACTEEDHKVQIHHVARKAYNFWGTITVEYGEHADLDLVVQAIAEMDEKLAGVLA